MIISKDRVLTSLAYCEPDRVPIDFSAEPDMLGKLLRDYGLLPQGFRADGADAVEHGARWAGCAAIFDLTSSKSKPPL